MNKWHRVWREGIAPILSSAGLRALQRAILTDDGRLRQGATCFPPACAECAVGGACAIGLCGWLGDGLRRVDEVEIYFARVCDAADAVLREPAACRYFLNWFDETPRGEMRRALLAEVTRALDGRQRSAA